MAYQTPTQQPIQVVCNAYTVTEAMELISRQGTYKGRMRPDKAFFSSFMAGCQLAFAGAVCITINSASWYQDNAPGMIKALAALSFPIGLVMIVLSGTDLCTGSHLYTTVAVLHRRLPWYLMLQHWTVTFFGNLAGSLFVGLVLLGVGGDLDPTAYRAEVIKFTTAKIITPTWGQILIRGIGCNWLIALACLMSTSSREFAGKVIAIWWPTFAFVALSFDHVVANMFFIPMGIYQGTPGVSVGFYIWKSMIPALIGNIIGAAFFVGVIFWYLFLTGTGPVPVDGLYYADDIPKLGGRAGSDGSVEVSHTQTNDTKHTKTSMV